MMASPARAISGEDRDAICDHLARTAAEVADDVLDRLAALRKLVKSRGDDAAQLAALLEQQRGYLVGVREALDGLAARPLRVVLMGRTQAGKSTLYCALTGASRELIGEGAQATTRAPQQRVAIGLPDVEIWDTPGVGAQDRPEDREAALDQARDADVVVWVCTNDSFQVEEQRALDEVLDWGTPVILVLHCFYSLSTPDHVDDFLADVEDHPVNVLAREEGHLARPRRAILARGQAAVVEVPVHALAYLHSVDAKAAKKAQHMRCASNMDALLKVLEREAVELRHLRRATATTDSVRVLITELDTLSREAAEQTEVASVAATKAADEARQYVSSVLQSAVATWTLQVEQTLAPFSTWADGHYRDDEAQIAAALKRDLEQSQAALQPVFEAEARRLHRKITERLSRSAAAWGQFQHETVDVKHKGRQLPSRLRAMAPDLVLTGAGVVALAVGASLPPVAIAIGLAKLVGVDKMLGRLFGSGSRRKALQRRRLELQESVNAATDKLRRKLDRQWATKIDTPWRDFMAQYGDELDATSRQRRLLAKRLLAFADSTQSDVARLDVGLVRTLHRLEGDEQGAATTERVCRVPGVLLAVEVPDLTTARDERFRTHSYLRGAAFVPAALACDDNRRLALLARPSKDRPWRIRTHAGRLMLVAPRPELQPLADSVAKAASGFLGRPTTTGSIGRDR